MRGTLLQGKTVEERLDHADLILQRLTRKAPGRIHVIVPPVPVCFYCSTPSESGLIGRWVAPVDGAIQEIHAYVGFVMDRLKPVLVITVVSGNRTESASMVYSTGAASTKTTVAVKAGDRIELSTTDPGSVGELSVSFLLVPSVARADKEKFVVDDILDKAEEVQNARAAEERKAE